MSVKLSLTWAHEGRVSYVHILFISCNKLFLYTTNGQQSNLICCHNVTLKCSTSRLRNYFKCLWNRECYVPCCDSSCLFTYFGFFGSQYNSSAGSVNSRLQNVNSQYQYVYCKVLTAELLELGAIFPNGSKYQDFWSFNFMLKELYFWSSLSSIKIWIANC